MNRLLFLLAMLCTLGANAQTDLDAFRYSQYSLTGTARFTSMGGAFTAVGGDFSSLSQNPAGMAIYRRSELTFTPSIYAGKTSSTFLGNTADDSRYNFNIANVGFVFTQPLTKNDEGEGWKSWNFGIGLNRINNFHSRSFYEGFNLDNSFTDYLAQQAQGVGYENLDGYYEYLGYYTYLINPDSLNNYTSAVPFGHVTQRRSSEQRGAITETAFSVSGNYSNKLFLGATLGFNSLRYTEESTYEELDEQNLVDSLKQFQFDQSLTTRGVGVNLKFGMIYWINEYVRFGAAVHTPTWYNMNDSYQNTMQSRFDGGYTARKQSPSGTFDYYMTTPFRAMGGLAFVFSQYGLVSADYEFNDISTARISATGFSFADVNNEIRRKYTATNTVRIGSEWRINNFTIRAGGGLTSSPMNSKYAVSGADFSQKSLTAGFGVRDKNVFLDFGYAYTETKGYLQPYTLNFLEVAGVRETMVRSNFTMTFGVKF